MHCYACRWGTRLMLGVLLLLVLTPSAGRAEVDLEVLATQIAQSLQKNLKDPRYKTVAISRIKVVGGHYNVDELIDFTNVKIVRSHHLRVIDRSKLQLILKEQQVQLSEFVSAQKYQELGQLLGVDLFIYGTFYKDALVLKGIDVQNSAIVWADVFPISAQGTERIYLTELGQDMMRSMDKDLDRLKKARINLVSFWNFDSSPAFSPEAVMDYLSVAITKDGHFKVVDRENLKLITEEQKLSQAVFIDEKNAKQLGELYGVDAFIYGSIIRRAEGAYLASLKMLNIYNGVIEWADLIKMDGLHDKSSQTAAMGPAGVSRAPVGMARVAEGIFVMGSNEGARVSSPLHQVKLPAFFIDETEVSNEDYVKFVKAQAYRAPVGWTNNTYPAGQGNYPVVGISWDDARLYCHFAGKRLPREAEWEKAARGTAGQMYPWAGTAFSPGFTVTRESGRKGPATVDFTGRDVSPYGVRNMAGNVREWVEDVFEPYPDSTARDPRFYRERVVRGGSWATDQRSAVTYFRGSSNTNLAWQDVGFRCAR